MRWWNGSGFANETSKAFIFMNSINQKDILGQWQGHSDGDPIGEVLVDCEVRDGSFIFVGFLFSSNPEIPSSAVEVSAPIGFSKHEENVPVLPFDQLTGRPLSKQMLAEQFPNAVLPSEAKVELQKSGEDELLINWSSAIGTHGKANLSRYRVPETSAVTAESGVGNWSEFQSHISSLKFGDWVFRGQSKPYPLQTAFHRTPRKILHYFLQEDIPALHRKLTGKTRHFFDLDRPQQLGAFLNLAQHHGYPTPLLDWTYSPFVAAWFAYHGAKVSGDQEGHVRIFALNLKSYKKLRMFQSLTFAPPHFSVLEALAIENDRAVRQQGLLTLTNIHNIEHYLQELEETNGSRYLIAFDLPKKETPEAINELAMMGITRATLFPSIENICLDAKEDSFSVRL